MAMPLPPTALVITVTPSGGPYSDHEVRLSGHLIGYRKWDGSSPSEVTDEVLAGLAALLQERFGWPQAPADFMG
jgi:hypothetical protein